MNVQVNSYFIMKIVIISIYCIFFVITLVQANHSTLRPFAKHQNQITAASPKVNVQKLIMEIRSNRYSFRQISCSKIRCTTCFAIQQYGNGKMQLNCSFILRSCCTGIRNAAVSNKPFWQKYSLQYPTNLMLYTIMH